MGKGVISLHPAMKWTATMLSEAGACGLWVEEKEQWLNGLALPERLEDLEVVQQR